VRWGDDGMAELHPNVINNLDPVYIRMQSFVVAQSSRRRPFDLTPLRISTEKVSPILPEQIATPPALARAAQSDRS
jgi:hypothetical protein